VTREPGIRGTPPPPAPGAAGPDGPDRLTTVLAYVLLFAFGLLQGLIGTFQYSRGPGPLIAVLFALAIGATCVLGAWGMRSPGGGLMPGVGWFLAAFALSTGTHGGSVLITNTPAGKWFLFGGAACAAVGCVISYLGWSRPGRSRSGGSRP
jgi:hypothetical protein